MVTSCNFEEMILFLQSGCKTNSLWTFLIISETYHVPPDFEIYVEWYLRPRGYGVCSRFIQLSSVESLRFFKSFFESPGFLERISTGVIVTFSIELLYLKCYKNEHSFEIRHWT